MEYKNKRKGSSLLLALGITLIVFVIGTVICSAILNTTRLNEDKEVYDSLSYAAESGIELGVSKIAKEKTNNPSWEPITQSDKKIIVSESEFNSNNIDIEVDIEQEKDDSGNIVNNRYLITSKAKNNKGKEKTVKATVGQYLGSNNIFENVLCSNSVDMSNGSLHASPGYMNMVHKSNIRAGSVQNNATSSPFTVPIYNFEKLDSSEIDRNASDISDLLTQLDRLINRGVRRIDITGIHGENYKVYLVNSDDLKVKFDSPGTKENFTIISSGNVEFQFDGTMHLVKSSIISKSFKVSSKNGSETTGGVSLNYPPFGEIGHSPLDEGKVNDLNSEISKYASNWSNNVSVGSVNSNYWGTIEYEY